MTEMPQKVLMETIHRTDVPSGHCVLWWLGQHGFAVKLGATVLLIDPYLSADARRLVPPILAPENAVGVTAVLGSHDHLDHIDRPVWPALFTASPSARFLVPSSSLTSLARELPLPPGQLIGMDDGRTVEVADVRITGIAAAHELLDPDPVTGSHRYLGFLIEANGCRIYHAGDTCIYEGLHARLRAFAPDVMLLPINGRDAARLRRGCIGNMTYQEAADLAGAVGPHLIVPTHFDMFSGNTEDPTLFADYMAVKYPHLPVRIPAHGQAIRFNA
jgi:L-ascorbate 6-phosphate lactonase